MLALLMLGLGALNLSSVGPARPFVPEPYAVTGTVCFANGTAICSGQDAAANGRYAIVQVPEPVHAGHLTRLRTEGFEPVGYIAYQNVICRRLPGAAATASVGTTLPLPSTAKLAPGLMHEPAARSGSYVLSVWPGEDPESVARAIAGMGGSVDQASARTVGFSLCHDRLADIAVLEGVAWIQPRSAARAFNSDVQWVVQAGWQPRVPGEAAGRPVWQHGIRGQNMVVGLFDSGIITSHEMFLDPLFPLTEPGIYPDHRKVAAYKLYPGARFGDAGGASYHGTGVAATLAGNDSVSGNHTRYEGIAPDSRIYFVDNANQNGTYIIDPDLSDLLDSVRLSRGMPEPVRQVSGSFGTGGDLSYYLLEEASLDAVCWLDQEFLVVWAAGNYGSGTYNIGHPAAAKNCLTVGATGNGTASNLLGQSSSGGPARDGRIKPTTMAPGDGVTTAYGPEPWQYAQRSGTSFSAPAMNGALLLMRQYLKEGWHPTGTPDSGHRITRTSSALLRALAVTASDSNVEPESVPNRQSGWGRLNLSGMMHFAGDSLALEFADESLGLATGEVYEYRFNVERRVPMTVSLAWTDTAAAPAASRAIVNDLNLELQSPDGNRFRGNQFYMGQSAVNPPYWDSVNVEEVCRLRLPLAGPWTLRVYGRNVFTARQPFALVVRSGTATPLPGIEEAAFEPGRSRTTIVSSWPLRLSPGRTEQLAVYGADGRLVTRTHVAGSWDGRDNRGCRLAPGVYCFVLGDAGGRAHRLVVLR